MSCKLHGDVCDSINAADRLISKASGDTGFNEDFLGFLDNENVLEAYQEPDQATKEERETLLLRMHDYINSRKLSV